MINCEEWLHEQNVKTQEKEKEEEEEKKRGGSDKEEGREKRGDTKKQHGLEITRDECLAASDEKWNYFEQAYGRGGLPANATRDQLCDYILGELASRAHQKERQRESQLIEAELAHVAEQEAYSIANEKEKEDATRLKKEKEKEKDAARLKKEEETKAKAKYWVGWGEKEKKVFDVKKRCRELTEEEITQLELGRLFHFNLTGGYVRIYDSLNDGERYKVFTFSKDSKKDMAFLERYLWAEARFPRGEAKGVFDIIENCGTDNSYINLFHSTSDFDGMDRLFNVGTLIGDADERNQWSSNQLLLLMSGFLKMLRAFHDRANITLGGINHDTIVVGVSSSNNEMVSDFMPGAYVGASEKTETSAKKDIHDIHSVFRGLVGQSKAFSDELRDDLDKLILMEGNFFFFFLCFQANNIFIFLLSLFFFFLLFPMFFE